MRAWRALVGCGVVIVGLTAAARAEYTTIHAPIAPGEKSVAQVLGQIYGGTFVPAGGHDLTNGNRLAVRIEDAVSGLSRPVKLWHNPETPLEDEVGVTDQIWAADSIEGEARARFAAFSQEFGFVDGIVGDDYTRLFQITGSGFDVGGEIDVTSMSNRIWRWGRNGDNGLFTSQNDDNPSDVDHMVTYRIEDAPDRMGGGGGLVTTYILFWEDLRPNQSPDYDYNDMVVEVVTTRVEVPEPAMGALALVGLAALRRRNRAATRTT
jgi:hypothetical protein